jgi:hypothetical protein
MDGFKGIGAAWAIEEGYAGLVVAGLEIGLPVNPSLLMPRVCCSSDGHCAWLGLSGVCSVRALKSLWVGGWVGVTRHCTGMG